MLRNMALRCELVRLSFRLISCAAFIFSFERPLRCSWTAVAILSRSNSKSLGAAQGPNRRASYKESPISAESL